MTRQYSFASRAAYALSSLLILLPLADIALGFFPLQPSSLRWRIGVIGLTIGALLMPLIGLFLALVTAHLSGRVSAHLKLPRLAKMTRHFFTSTLTVSYARHPRPHFSRAERRFKAQT